MMNRNRILLVYRGGTAGILSTVSNQARRLAMEGFETTLVLMGDPDRGRNHQEIEGVEVRWLHLWSRKLPKNGFGWFVKYLEFSIRVFIKTLFDPAKLVVANDIDSLLPVWPAARLSGKRLAYFAVELYAERPGVPAPWLWRCCERFFARRVDATISCQEDRTRFMIENYGTKEPVLTVRNVPFWKPLAQDHHDQIRTWLKTRGVANVKVALYQGMLTARRCVYELAEAGAYLDPEIVIVLIGDMSEKIRKKFDEIRDRFGTRQKVFVHEYVLPDELGPLTASCDLGLVFQKNVGANTFYAAPIKLYQYLAAGLPVVGSNFPSVTRILEDPERPVGFGADPEDPQAIAKAINTLFANEKQYLQFHENALWLAENRYRYDKESEALVALYRRLCES